MTTVAVIQARSGSSRLPGKALLQFHGLPLAVLAARRAASTGIEVILATSDHWSDDPLAVVAGQYGISCFRGPLDNVLGRFTQALEAYPDETIVARLTGDNVLPDGSLIEEVEREFLDRNLDYISTTHAASGLPYGASIELTRLGHLREADRRATTAHDREHVTPYVIRKFGHVPFVRHGDLGKGGFRATIDCFDDFISLHRVFPDGQDPVAVGWKVLVDRLPLGLFQPVDTASTAQLVMGTAQLGQPYGIANQSILDEDERGAMIKTAIGSGVQYLDTAQAYGRSEEVIGATLAGGWTGRCRIVTKLSPLADLPDGLSEEAVRATVENGVLRSCLALRQTRLDTFLLHRAAHLTAWNGAVWKKLRELRAEGRILTLGVSVQSPAELLAALGDPDVGHVQLPYNILDSRWQPTLAGIAEVKATRPLVVHVRSALLQGLLASDRPAIWRRALVTDPMPILSWLDGLASTYRRESVSDLCLAWARSHPWIDGVVVGSDNLAQLELNLRQFCNPVLPPEALSEIEATRPAVADETLDPARWLPEVRP